MQLIIFFLIFTLISFADFSIKYKLDDSTIQSVNYKNEKNILFTIRQNGKIIEKLLIKDNKKYIIFNDNGIEHIYEISDELSSPIKQNSKLDTLKYKFIKKISNLKIAGFNAEKWLIESGGIKEEVIVSKDKILVNSLNKVMEALKKILPSNKQSQASIFNMGNGYVLVKTGSLELTSYNNKKLNKNIFDLYTDMPQKEQKELSQNINKCFTNVCCGEDNTNATQIESFLNKNLKKWHIKKFAKCQSFENIESAIFTNNKEYVTVEMTTSSSVPSGKIESLKEQGVEIKDIKESTIGGFKTLSAYLPEVNATITDIMLPNTVISLYSKGKKDLYDFAKKALKLKIAHSFSAME